LILSIITVNKDNASGLEKTIQSVICQTYTDYEFIIIDGNSTDGSADVIKKYSAKINYWVSEPDTGIYNAMNKAIRKAQGEFCLFLNSGDWLIGFDSLENAFDLIKKSDDADIYYGNCLDSEYAFEKMPYKLSIDDLYLQIAPNHQNTFIKRDLFNKHEFYNENYPTVSDSIFFVKELWGFNTKFSYINTIISIYSVGGISSVYKFDRQELHNEMKIIMGNSKYTVCVMRSTIKFVIKKIIKYILPYGIAKLVQIKFPPAR
jgi:glycosyltransferase involved in cell wall biosynthesis